VFASNKCSEFSFSYPYCWVRSVYVIIIVSNYHPISPHDSIISIDEVCHVCRKACLNTVGEHVVRYEEFPDFKYKHDFARDVLFDIFRQAKVFVKKETHVNLSYPLDGRSTLRPADVMVYR